MNVTITRTIARYRRARNGGWIGNGSTVEKFKDIPEERAANFVLCAGLSTSIDVEWPDGHREHFGHGTSLGGIHGPGNSRLRPYAAGPVYGDPESEWSAWYPQHKPEQKWSGR